MGGTVRPTTSRVLSALFSMFGPEGVRGLRVLDIYAGTGGFGLEAVRRGAASVGLVERDARLCEALRLAAEKAGSLDRTVIHRGDALKVLARMSGQFDVVFADPPYADNPFEAVAGLLVSRDLIASDATVIFEHSRRLELPESLAGLRSVTTRTYGDAAVSVYRRTEFERAGEGT
jgi:16S rRNA (guanine966-N2)-methyltransferase